MKNRLISALLNERILAAIIIGLMVSVAIILRPIHGFASSNGNAISQRMQTGFVTATSSVSTQNYIEACDNFSPAFNTGVTPAVAISLQEHAGSSDITGVAPETAQVYSVSNTGFCVRIGSRNNANFPSNFSVDIYWTAVGQ